MSLNLKNSNIRAFCDSKINLKEINNRDTSGKFSNINGN